MHCTPNLTRNSPNISISHIFFAVEQNLMRCTCELTRFCTMYPCFKWIERFRRFFLKEWHVHCSIRIVTNPSHFGHNVSGPLFLVFISLYFQSYALPLSLITSCRCVWYSHYLRVTLLITNYTALNSKCTITWNCLAYICAVNLKWFWGYCTR